MRTFTIKSRVVMLAALLLLAGLSACNLPDQTGPDAPISPTAIQAIDTLPAPGITAMIESPTSSPPTVPAVTALPTDTSVPPTDTPVPPTATSPAPSNTPAPTTAGAGLTITRIDMVDSQKGFAEGFPGGSPPGLYRTADGGLTWTLINPPGGYGRFGKFFALNAQVLWAAPGMTPPQGSSGLDNGYIYRSLDGGQTWTASQPIPLVTGEVSLVESFFPNSLFFLDANQGWMVVSVGHYMNQDVYVILSTADGGLSWTRKTDKMQATVNGGACLVVGIAFVDATHGFLAANCLAVGMDERWKVLESIDAGRTWNPKEMGAPVNAPAAVTGSEVMCAPVGLRFQTPQTFILDYSCQVYDSNAAIPFYYFTFVSSDGGSTWAGAQVESADFYSTTGGLALGPRAANGDRYFYTTSDGGRNWVKGNKVTWSNAQLSYLDALKGWAVVWRVNPVTGVTEYALVKTINGDGPWGLITPKVK